MKMLYVLFVKLLSTVRLWCCCVTKNGVVVLVEKAATGSKVAADIAIEIWKKNYHSES
jgi:hypothetical protein